MHGNVQEWCNDWYAEYEPVAVLDPKGMISGQEHVLRGGNICSIPKYCRSSKRLMAGPEDCGQQSTVFRVGYGFRVVLHP